MKIIHILTPTLRKGERKFKEIRKISVPDGN